MYEYLKGHYVSPNHIQLIYYYSDDSGSDIPASWYMAINGRRDIPLTDKAAQDLLELIK